MPNAGDRIFGHAGKRTAEGVALAGSDDAGNVTGRSSVFLVNGLSLVDIEIDAADRDVLRAVEVDLTHVEGIAGEVAFGGAVLDRDALLGGTSLPSAHFILTSSVPDLMTLPALVTSSVNHAKVVPSSMVKHSASARRSREALSLWFC